MIRRFGGWFASALTRVLLWMYPSSFRREMGRQIEDDVRRRAGEVEGPLAPAKMVVWLVRLSGSLVLNAVGAWREVRAAPAARRAVGKSGPFSWLDVKLGLRMLLRNPGLTIVSIITLAIGIPASLIPVHTMHALFPSLPFEEGERIVGIENFDMVSGRSDRRALHDFFVWRDELASFEAVAAARIDNFNVISDDGRAAPLPGAEMTASGFRIVRMAPSMGRALIESDELPGAADVVVISHDLWQARLGGDSGVLGKTIDIGSEPHQVVGVMPEGFLFPFEEQLWLPLRYRPTDFERREGPYLYVFGRLADGASAEDARAELETVGGRLSVEFPDTHAQLRPQLLRFAELAFWRIDRAGTYGTQLLALALLMIVCGNVGTLILARTASRSGEIAVRTALGASRGRIVSQLFVESLVLAVAATGVGLLLADYIAARFQVELPWALPYWVDFGVTPGSVVLALSVAALCAVVAGVLPALRATGHGVGVSLQSAGAGSGMRFGRAATLLIVGEVALTVALFTVGSTLTYALVENEVVGSEIDSDEYLRLTLEVPSIAYGDHLMGYDPDSLHLRDFRGTPVPEFREHVTDVVTELRDRLAAEPGVRGVAMGNRVPEEWHPDVSVEVEGEEQGDDFRGHRIHNATVDIGFFDGLGHDVLVGRGFNTGDLVATARGHRSAVVVNTAFVEHVLGGGNPLGRRVRYIVRGEREPDPWYEIVGVVGHLGMNGLSSRDQGMYHPAAVGEIHPVQMAIRLGEDPLGFVPRMREITSEVDAGAMILWPGEMSDTRNAVKTPQLYGYLLLVFLCGMTLMLSGAGLYSLMSFTVSQRTREIGIRTALGAGADGIMIAVARRTFLQLVAGIAVGAAVGLSLVEGLRSTDFSGPDPAVMLVASSAFMLLIGMLACLGPTLRALRIEPVEALNEG